jgi:hypothetical protein
LSSLAKNTRLQNALLRQVYTAPALTPVNPGDAGPVSRPTITSEKKSADQRMVRWSVPAGQMVSVWILQVKRGNDWETRILPGKNRSELVNTRNASAICVTAVSRFRNASPPATLTLP